MPEALGAILNLNGNREEKMTQLSGMTLKELLFYESEEVVFHQRAWQVKGSQGMCAEVY